MLRYSLILLLLCCFQLSNCQKNHYNNKEKRNARFGIVLGPNLTVPSNRKSETWANVLNNPTVENSSRVGIAVGLFHNIALRRKQMLMVGINYTYVSHNTIETIGFYTDNYNTNRSYLTIPIMYKARLKILPGLLVGGGIYSAYLITARKEGTLILDAEWKIIDEQDIRYLPPEYSKTEYYNDCYEDYKKIDFGINLQLEYELIRTKYVIIGLLAKLNLGLVNSYYSEFYSWNNIGLLTGLSIGF